MVISATLTNSDNCQFDSCTFDAPWGVKNREAASLAKAKRWAAGRGGEYGLAVDKDGGDQWVTIGEFYYSGQCKRAVAL